MLKSQDIVIALYLANEHNSGSSVREISSRLEISIGEISNSLKRLVASKLLDASSRKILKANLMEFLVHGLQYVFPPEKMAPGKGLPTAWGHEVFSEISANEIPVLQHIDGKAYGPAIKPFYKNMANALLRDKELYMWVAVVDALRMGRSREKKIAIEKLKELLG